MHVSHAVCDGMHVSHAVVDSTQGIFFALLKKLQELALVVENAAGKESTDSATIAELREEIMMVYSHLLDLHRLVDDVEERISHLRSLDERGTEPAGKLDRA